MRKTNCLTPLPPGRSINYFFEALRLDLNFQMLIMRLRSPKISFNASSAFAVCANQSAFLMFLLLEFCVFCKFLISDTWGVKGHAL